MANMELIGGPTGGQISSAQSSITFSNIPQTYTDLKIMVSARSTFTGANWAETDLTFNGSSSYSSIRLQGNGSSADSYSSGSAIAMWVDSNVTTSNTFGNAEIYIPNYTSSNQKSVSIDFVGENNATGALSGLVAGLSTLTSAITSITLTSINGDYMQGSTFYLYGISNVTSGSKATGGIVSSDGTYWYHMFPYSSTFTPTQSLTADYLVIAGGGGGAGNAAGGGGAGGLRSTVSATGGGGALESTVALISGTAYTVTVGAAGSAGGGNSSGGSGSNSSIAGAALTTITSTGGGGGGAGALGGTPTNNTTNSGVGGIGALIPNFANATQTGTNNGYYAGGGGGSANSGSVQAGGLGGGGAGGLGGSGVGVTGVTNTGGGGGGGGNVGASGAGGSGLVIIRYAI